jgi:hypothetical protein
VVPVLLLEYGSQVRTETVGRTGKVLVFDPVFAQTVGM